MSDYDVSLKFNIDVDSIQKAKKKAQEDLNDIKVTVKNFDTTIEAAGKLRSQIENKLQKSALNVHNIKASTTGISSLKQSIQESIKNTGLLINELKVGSLNLGNVKLSRTDLLKASVESALNSGTYSIKVKDIDASAAIKKVTSQLELALKEAGFIGQRAAAVSANAGATDTKELSKKMRMIDGMERVAKTAYSDLSTGKNAITDIGALSRYEAAWREIEKWIAQSRIQAQGLSMVQIEKSIIPPLSNVVSKFKEAVALGKELNSIRVDPKFINSHKSAIEDLNNAGLRAQLAEVKSGSYSISNPILEKLSAASENIKKGISSGKGAIIDVDSLKLLDEMWEKLQDRIRTADELEKQFADPAVINQAIESANKVANEYREAVAVLKELNKLGASPALSGGVDIESWKEQLKEAKDVDDRLTKLKKKLESATSVGKGDISGSENFNEIEARFNRLIESRERLKAANTSEDVQRMTASFHEEARAIEELIVRQRELAMEQSRAAKQSATKEIKLDSPASAQSMTNLASQMQAYLSANSAIFKNEATKAYASQIQSYINTLEKGLSGATVVTERSAKEMGVSFKNMKRDIRELGVSGQTLFERFTKGFEKFGGWMIITSALMEGVNIMHQAVANVFELDKAMTELKKVTDETATSYENFFKTAEERSKIVGSTLTDLVNATADFSRLGYNMTDAEGLAEVAILYRNVGDGIESVNDSSQSIISSLKAFYSEGEAALDQIQEAQHIVDVYNELGNSFPIDSKGVGDALTRSAAALSVAGNTFEESAALAVAANAIVQDPEKVGKRMCPTAQQCAA